MDKVKAYKGSTGHMNRTTRQVSMPVNSRTPRAEGIGNTHRKGIGDLGSQECVDMLKHTEIVVTNSPFSLFREDFVQLMEFDKKFVTVGNQTAITYWEKFTLIREHSL